MAILQSMNVSADAGSGSSEHPHIGTRTHSNGFAGSAQDRHARSSRNLGRLAAGLLLVACTGLAQAQQRFIVLNGQRLSDAEIAMFDRVNCGNPVPNGNYWLNFERREWGYVGMPGTNALPECRTVAAQESRSSADDCKRYRFSEDRMECMMRQMQR